MKHRKTCRRFNDVGHAHFLTFSCYHRQPFLSRDRSRQWMLDAIARAREQYDFHLWAYVIMPEHVHLLIWPARREYSISAILKTQAVGGAAGPDVRQQHCPTVPQPHGGPPAARGDRLPILAAWRRIRQQPHPAAGHLGDHRIHPRQPGAAQAVHAPHRLALVQCPGDGRPGIRRPAPQPGVTATNHRRIATRHACPASRYKHGTRHPVPAH
jgi:hypothetical protein